MNEPKASELCLLPLERLKSGPEELQADFLHYLNRHLGRFLGCSPSYMYAAMAYTLRDRLITDWRDTWIEYKEPGVRRAYYMSLEFLIGRSLGNHILNMGLDTEVERALHDMLLDTEEIMENEPDAGLGNGGLGRLAACFIDSCATLQLPVIGYGIRYEYGMFRQEIRNGRQIEEPDHWLRDGNPWELERPEYTQRIHFGGHTEIYKDEKGRNRVRWVDTNDVLAIPYDVPVSGYRNKTVNTLSLIHI